MLKLPVALDTYLANKKLSIADMACRLTTARGRIATAGSIRNAKSTKALRVIVRGGVTMIIDEPSEHYIVVSQKPCKILFRGEM